MTNVARNWHADLMDGITVFRLVGEMLLIVC